MSEKHLISHDPDAGITQYYHFDEITGDRALETVWTSNIDEVNPEAYNAHSDHKPTAWKGDWHHVASIPNVILEQWRRDGILNDQKAFKAKLNDRDNLIFRTKPGKI